MSDSFAQLPRAIQFQMAIIGPLLLGLVCGFFLGINAVAYWVVSIAGIVGGIAGGADFGGDSAPARPNRAARDPRREAAARGLVAGCLFGVGVLVAHAASGDPAQAPLPPFEPLFVVFSGVIGMVLAYLGASLGTRPT